MTTLAELIDADPDDEWGYPVPELQFGGGTWRFAFMIADQGAGSSVQWYDLTGPVSQVTWTRGSSSPRGRFEAIEPAVQINAIDDTYAPWNSDTSGVFGTHVPLRAGRLLMRASVFRVSGTTVNLHIPLFTARVRRWSDAQASGGGYRFHRVDGIDLMSYLVQAPIGAQNYEGWYNRITDLLSDADWPFGSSIYGAQTADSTTTLVLSNQAAADSAITAIDAALDPVGITWRTTAKGEFVAHPYPWDTFHAGLFASTTETIVGSEWTAPIETYYPTGPTFAYNAGPDEVQFTTEVEGGSFGINSDIENVANEWQITHPVVTTNLDSGFTTSAYDDAVSGGRYGRRAIPAASWLAENDTVLQDFIDASAYTDLTAAPMTIDVRNEGVFPAIALLDHFDPCEIRHSSQPGRTEVTVGGSIRQVAHTMTKFGPHLLWSAVVQVDVDTEATSSPLNPVTNLAVVPPVTDTMAGFSWTNPSQTVTPTGTQVRIPGVSALWVDLPYPGTGSQSKDWLFLNPSTFYEFEVRLIREVNGAITHVSPTRSVAFTTAAPTVPIVDPTDPGGETIIIPTDPGGCEEIDWKLESSDDGSAWTLVDSGDESDFTDVDGELQLDLSAQSWTAGLLYRVCTRTACDPPGVGSYVCSEPFQPDCATPAQLSEAPFDDASLKLYIPQVCGATIEDAVSDLPVSLGPDYAGVGYDDASEYVLLSSSDGGVVCYGDSENLPLTDGDRSIHWRGKFDTAAAEDILWRVGRLRLAVVNSSGLKFAAIKSFSGGSITAVGTTTVADDTEYDVYATWDRDTATVAIIVDGVEEDTAEDAAAYVNTPNLPSYSARLPASSWGTDYAVWESVLTEFGPTSVEFVAMGDLLSLDTGAGDYTVDMPAGTEAGDVAVLVACVTGSNEITEALTGWTLRSYKTVTDTSNNGEFAVWTKVLSGGDSDVTVNKSGSQPLLARIYVFRGLDGTIVDMVNTHVNGNDSVSPDNGTNIGPVTTTAANQLIFAVAGYIQVTAAKDWGGYERGAGFTELHRSINVATTGDAARESNLAAAYLVASTADDYEPPSWVVDGTPAHPHRFGVSLVIS